MNDQRTRNDNYRLVDPSKSLPGETKYGVIRINTNNSLEHEWRKFSICYSLKKKGHWFLTECKFKNGCRADVFDLDDGIAFEIVKSESEESIIKKSNKYPCKIEVVKV